MKFLLIDLNNYFSRFYFANKDNCVERYIKLIKDSISQFQPNYLCNLIDAPISFRKALYSEYKSQRPEKPSDYYELLENLKFNLKKLNYPYQTSKSLEAEDLANLFITNIEDCEFIVLSNDKDCLQLELDDPEAEYSKCRIFDYFNQKDKNGNFIKFLQKSYTQLGLKTAHQFLLYLSLMGDSSDNIPGVKGIGKQKALYLANLFESFEDIYSALIEKNPFDRYIKNDCYFNIIREDLENFQLSYKLVCLFEEKFEFNLEKYKI